MKCLKVRSARRKKILEKLIPSETENGRLMVNRKYCCIVSRDTDLQYLIKTGKVYLVNIVETGGYFVNKYSTKKNLHFQKLYCII